MITTQAFLRGREVPPFNLSGVGTNLRRIKRALWIKWKMETHDSAIGFHTRKGQPSSDV